MNEQQGLDPMFQENGSQWMEGGLASEPLNVYTAKTFGWMFLGLLVTFGTAIAFSAGGGLYYLLTMGMPAVFALAIAEIVVVMVLSACSSPTRCSTASRFPRSFSLTTFRSCSPCSR